MPGTFNGADIEVDTATHAIPDENRAGKLSLTMSWWGVASALFYIFLASNLALTYGTINTIIAMVLSVISYGILNTILARYAIKTGLSVALFSRILFGRVGALLATAIFALTAAYYAVFEGSVIAVAADKVIPGVSYGTACILVVLYSVPMVFGSVQNFLDKINGILLPFYAVGLVAAVVATIAKYGYSSDWLSYVPADGASATGWVNGYIAYMGIWVLMMFTFDYARFGAKKDVRYHTLINFGSPFYILAFLICGLVGIFITTSASLADVSETVVVDQLIVVLGGAIAFGFIFVSQTRINSANFYLATVNTQAFFAKLLRFEIRKWVWAIIVGLAVLIAMRASDVFTYINTALIYQGIFVTAWVAVAVTHIVSSKYDRMFGGRTYYHDHEVPAINPAGVTAWFAGAGSGLAMTLADVGTTWAPVVTVVLSTGVYAAALRFAKPSWFATAVREPESNSVAVTEA